MIPSQADAIVQAILQPDNKREAVQQRQRAQAHHLARQRAAVAVAWSAWRWVRRRRDGCQWLTHRE